MCGRCCDAPPNPERHQPGGHTVDVHFFKVSARDNPTKEDFEALVKAEFPHWLDGTEHNYIQCGAEIGDQGIALATFGLGELLGVWKLLSPETVMCFLPKEARDALAGVGMIAIQFTKGDNYNGIEF
jgi:hypothetical protein